MDEKLFSGDVIVELQGEDALTLVNIEEKRAVFTVNGFEDENITIEDYRVPSVEGLRYYLETEDVQKFHEGFNSSAFGTIEKDQAGNYKISLIPTQNFEPVFVLWFAIGIGKIIPAYDYEIIDSRPIGQDQFALFALYYFPDPPLPTPLSYSEFVRSD